MGQQIATLEYLSKAKNGRLGDFAEITNKALGTNFEAQNGFIGDKQMPEPERYQNEEDFNKVGYRGDKNIGAKVQNNVTKGGNEVKEKTQNAVDQYNNTGGSPEKHFENSQSETKAVNAGNQAQQKEKAFLHAQEAVHPSNVLEGTAVSQYNKTPIGSKEFDRLVSENASGLTDAQYRYLKASRTAGWIDAIDIEGNKQSIRDRIQPEKADVALYQDVERMYVERYGSTLSKSELAERVGNSYKGIKMALDNADIQSKGSLSLVSNFNQRIREH